MKAIFPIAAGFIPCIFAFCVLVVFLPDQYRIHPKLHVPQLIPIHSPGIAPTGPAIKAFSEAMQRSPTDPSVLLIGDSIAAIAPWPYAKIIRPGESSLELCEVVAHLQVLQKPERIIIMTGTWLLYIDQPDTVEPETKELVDAVTKRFPSCPITVISPFFVHDVARSHTIDGGWHPDETGYDIIKSKYPELG